MRLPGQILTSLVLVALAGGGWYAYEHRAALFGAESAAVAGGGQGRPAGGAGGGGPRGPGILGPPLVVASTVTTDSSGAEVRAIGTLAAEQAVTLYPQVTGIVSAVNFKAGQAVKTGDVLLTIDEADQQVAVDKAEIALTNARAARERIEKLVKTSNATTVQLTDAQVAEKQAEIDLRSARLELAKRKITAPFEGTVGLTDIAVGDLINSQKAITTLDELTTLKVSFDVPERVSRLVKVGEPIHATSDAVPGTTISGTIAAVDSRIDPTARTLKVEAKVPNSDGVLKPGTAIVISLAFPGEPQPSVASLAVQWDRQGPFVWKLDGDVVHRVPIQILTRRSGMVTVSATDLDEGDLVVVEGVLRLREGLKVQPTVAEGGEPVARSGEPGAPKAEAPGTEPDRKT
jgi:RND family efflux transporter MFP subunit